MTAFIIPETPEGALAVDSVTSLLGKVDPNLDSVVTETGTVVFQPLNPDDSNAVLEVV